MAYPYRKFIKPPLGSKPYKGHRLSRGLVGLWLFNEGSGSQVFDLSGNGNNIGTLVNGTSWIDGQFGPAIYVDATSQQYVNIPDSPELRPGTGDFTIWFWLKWPVGGEQWGGVLSKGMYGSALAHTWGFICDEFTNKINYQQATDAGGAYGCNIASPACSDGWHFVLVRRSGSTVQMFIDGIFHAEDVTAGDDLSCTDSITIGTTKSSRTDNYTGAIDIPGLIMRCLTDSEIAQLYREPFCMFKNPVEIAVLSSYYEAPPVGMAGAMTTNTGYWGW